MTGETEHGGSVTGAAGDGGAGRDPAVVLSVRDLEVRFRTKRGVARVVNGVSYDLRAGETLAIVGESGSGKSVGTMSLMGLLARPPAEVDGSALLDGRDLLALTPAQLRRVRGKDIAMVFQDPMTSLNPVLTVERQLTEHMAVHLGLGGGAARSRALELLELVGIPSPQRRLREYPHQFSGGMRQRVVIAMALACDPKVLIADEPTTALDVTIQAQIVDLVQRLQDELGMAVIWITHDLGVVAGIADRVLVMYAGQVLEEAGVDALYAGPRHPYTQALIGALPVLGPDRPGELVAIGGLPPDPLALPPGCAFHPRCPHRRDERCATERPPLREVAPGHRVRCFYDVPAEATVEAAQS